MSPHPGTRLLGWLALLWCVAWSRDLIGAWLHAPYDRLGPVAAVAWMIALRQATMTTCDVSGGWLLGAGLLSFVGIAGELNVALHLALAMAAAAVVGGRQKGLALLLLAIGWMPALGWVMRWAGPAVTNLVRLFDAGLAIGLAWRWKTTR